MRKHLPAVFAAAMTLAGCGAEAPGPGARVQVGDTVDYGSVGTTAEIDCGNGKSLNVGGSNNTLTVSGTCESVRVVGSDNTIRLNRVDGRLSVAGLNNAITYKAGDPSVDDSGSGNRISRG